MECDYPTRSEPATADYVLAVIQDLHRQANDPEVDSRVHLAFQTRVEEWRDACDLLPSRELAVGLNHFFGVDIPIHDWSPVLEPSHEKTLADVCEFLAGKVQRQRIRPAFLFGSACRSAGAFLTIRSLLHAAGADADSIWPSTPLRAYTRRYRDAFLGPISRLAPGTLPPVTRASRFAAVGCLAFLVGLLVFVPGMIAFAAGGIEHGNDFGTLGVCLMAIGQLFVYLAVWRGPDRVQFGDLRTFRDLAEAIVAGDRD